MSDESPTHVHPVDLVRTVGDAEVPAAGLWNVPPGWATIKMSATRLLGATMRSSIQLKQGMIAIADNPSHSTAHLSLDPRSIRTGDEALDEYLHREVLDVDRYRTIPVHIACVQHRDGRAWSADGWMTIRGIATPLVFEVTYEGSVPNGPGASFRVHASVPLRDILPATCGLRGRFFASRTLRITMEIHAEPVAASAARMARSRLPQLAVMSSSRHTPVFV